MTVQIRPASDRDTSAIALLNEEVQQLHAEIAPTVFRTGMSHREVSAFFADKLSAAGHNLRLAERDGIAVGYIWFEVQNRPETLFHFARKRFYIHHLSVRRSAHRTGVGSALLGAVQTEALAAGITNIALDTWALNSPALRFFESHGFSPFNLVLGKCLI
jgi:ribosomal protein S18 acetylase RimI-like enzyme